MQAMKAKLRTNSYERLESRRLMSAMAPAQANGDAAFDAAGTLYAVQADPARHDLEFATRSPDGVWSSPAVVDASPVDAAAGITLALDRQGGVGVTYRDAANELMYAHLVGGTWTTSTVATKTPLPQPSLAYDTLNRPLISYYRSAGGQLRLAWWDGAAWRIRSIASVGKPQNAHSSIAVNPADGTWAVTFQTSGKVVEFAAQVPPRPRKGAAAAAASPVAGRVRLTKVDRVRQAGAAPALAFDSTDRPAVSYYDMTSGQVKLARYDGRRWQVGVVSGANGLEVAPRLVFDSANGSAQVTFTDASGSIWMASDDGGTFQTTSLQPPDRGQPSLFLPPPAQVLYPAAAWDGTAGSGYGAAPPVDPARTTGKPSAAFDEVPYQDISGDWQLGVLAFANGGVSEVRFFCEGNTADVYAPTLVTRHAGRPYPAYVITLQTSSFRAASGQPINGDVTVYAQVIPADPALQPRVISIQLHEANNAASTDPVRYVDAVNGSDTNPGTAQQPMQTLLAARDSIVAANNGDAGGGVIYCEPGSYPYGGNPPFDANAADRWLTVTPAPGVGRGQVVLFGAGTAGLRAQKVHLKFITWDGSNGEQIDSPTALVDYLWLDGCDVHGSGRTQDYVPIPNTSWTGLFATDTVAHDARDGLSEIPWARDCVVHDIGSDAFQNTSVTIVCETFGTNSNGTGFHPDVNQFVGSAQNILHYGLYAHDEVDTQGFFSNGFDAATISDYALVNCTIDCSKADSPWNFSQFYDCNLSNVLVAGCTFLNNPWRLIDSNASGNTVERATFTNNVFSSFEVDAIPKTGIVFTNNRFPDGTPLTLA